jgi:glycine/D-amino acid oxidase-like deaminating enzyme
MSRLRNNSPWIAELTTDREIRSLTQDKQTQSVVVGAGIAGVATAYHLLRDTDEQVVLVEKGRLASGATGHNAGQMVAHFERTFEELSNEFSLEAMVDAQKSIEHGWEIFDRMYRECGLKIPFHTFDGHIGYSRIDQLVLDLKDSRLKKRGGLSPYPVRVSETVAEDPRLQEFVDLFEIVPHAEVLKLLETECQDFIAVETDPRGVINSALLCEKVIEYLLVTYADRFSFYENTDIKKVVLHHDQVLLDAEKATLRAGRVVLCTNGFEHLKIFDESGLGIDTKFHHDIQGTIGYMSAYLETHDKPPSANSYFTKEPPRPGQDTIEPYYYLTRRPYDYGTGAERKAHNLISIGGPERNLEDRKEYIAEYEYPEQYAQQIDTFIKKVYETDPGKHIDYIFTWHGLMGYTRTKVRIIGHEPKNPRLMYNVGCNGIGILPSLYGAWKIGQLCKGVSFKPQVFDPQ